MDNIIFFTEEYALGDEIHMIRNILLNLLYNNCISTNIIIYCISDRAFFYENIFKNVISFKQGNENVKEILSICRNKFNKEFIIIRFTDICYTIWQIWDKFGSYANSLNKNISITKQNMFNFEKINYYNKNDLTDEFKKLILNIKYLDNLPKFQNEKYIVYHHRIKNDNTWDQNDNILNKILRYNNKYNIVIFSQKKFNFNNEKIYTTSNLQEYTSYIHSDNCLATISVWSGGGQLASYCSNSKIIMFFDPCQCQYNINENQLNEYINSENAFDFCQFTNIKRFFIKIEQLDNLDNLIES
jgi:hypothetical protein